MNPPQVYTCSPSWMLLKYLFIFIYSAVPSLSCHIWDVVSRPGIKPGPCALGAQSLSHWTIREVPLWGENFVSKCRSLAEINWEGVNFICRMGQSVVVCVCVCLTSLNNRFRPPTSWSSAYAWWKKSGVPRKVRFLLLPNVVVPRSTWRPPGPWEASRCPSSSTLALSTIFMSFANQRILLMNLNKLATDFFQKRHSSSCWKMESESRRASVLSKSCSKSSVLRVSSGNLSRKFPLWVAVHGFQDS